MKQTIIQMQFLFPTLEKDCTSHTSFKSNLYPTTKHIRTEHKIMTGSSLWDLMLLPQCRWGLCSYELLHTEGLSLFTDILGWPISPILKGQAVQEEWTAWPKMLVNNYQYTLQNNPEKWRMWSIKLAQSSCEHNVTSQVVWIHSPCTSWKEIIYLVFKLLRLNFLDATSMNTNAAMYLTPMFPSLKLI